MTVAFRYAIFDIKTSRLKIQELSSWNSSDGTKIKKINDKRVKAAFVSLTRNVDLVGIRKTMRQIEDRFNRNYNYPYIFLNDKPFTDEFKKGVQVMTKANVTFGLVEGEAWSYPSYIDKQKAAEMRKKAKYMYGKSESYRFMCRFQSGYFYRHPLLDGLEYYWRIEPDVEYFCDMDYDPFKYMKENKLVYGWNMAPMEFMATIPTLWDSVLKFMDKYPQHIEPENFIKYVSEDGKKYNGCHFWTNFEIAELSFYRSKKYEDFFNFLDREGGFFYERWGDAPVHTIAAAMFLKKEQVHHFSDVGYYHPKMGFCPANSDKIGKCICDSKKMGEFRFKCRRRWDIINSVKPKVLA